MGFESFKFLILRLVKNKKKDDSKPDLFCRMKLEHQFLERIQIFRVASKHLSILLLSLLIIWFNISSKILNFQKPRFEQGATNP